MEHCRFRGDILEVQRPKSKCQTKSKCLNDLGVGLGTEDWRLEIGDWRLEIGGCGDDAEE
jgi:hypothetical protein